MNRYYRCGLASTRVTLWIIAALLLTFSAGCKRPPKQLGEVPIDSTLEITGKVTWVDLEGGFWGILRDEGEAKYRPINLPEAYQIDGLRVRLNCQRVQGGISLYQWGQEIKIITIESVKKNDSSLD